MNDTQTAALVAEVDRLTGALKTANDQAERFEREWYLRGDEVERLTNELAEAKRHKCPNLLPVISWLENGGSPVAAAKELSIYQHEYYAATPRKSARTKTG